MKAHQNPFCTSKLKSLPYLLPDGLSIESLARDFLERTNQHPVACLLGNHGSGKSKLLKLIGQQLKEWNYPVTFLSAAKHQLRDQGKGSSLSQGGSSLTGSNPNGPIPFDEYDFTNLSKKKDSIVLLDCGESLGFWGWWKFRFFTRHCQILTTVHKKGRIPVLYHCQPGFQEFHQLVSFLTASCDQPFQNWFESQFPPAKLESVLSHHGGDFRQSFFFLYDQCSNLRS